MSLGRQALGDEVLNNMSFLSQNFFLIVAFGKFNLALLVPISAYNTNPLDMLFHICASP
jgi:hypothetical protein